MMRFARCFFRYYGRVVVSAKPPSLLILIPYFGQWPFWMPLFLKSCEFNPDINWLLIGDCGEPLGLPGNVQYRYCGYAGYCDHVSALLGLQFYPQNPYKLCDLKPALGFIHQQETEGYDFWGFGDLDLVYGDLRSYFTEEKLRRYDFFSTHARRVSGHLCLLRNNERMRNLFWQIPMFHERIQDQQHHALDEGGFSRLFLKRKNFPEPLFKLVGLFNPLRRAAEFQEAFSTPNGKVAWVDGTRDFPDCWQWEMGRLTNDRMLGKTYPYFHFLGWKRLFGENSELTDPVRISALAAAQKWRIDCRGFHPA